MSDWNDAIEAAAKIAEEYAEENQRMASDTLLVDPILNRDGATEKNFELANELMIEGCIHSSMYHAASNIAGAIRERLMRSSTPSLRQGEPK